MNETIDFIPDPLEEQEKLKALKADKLAIKEGRKMWSREIQDRFLDWMAHGKTIQWILKQPGMPSWGTVRRRLANDEAFVDEYEKAKLAKADYLADVHLSYAEAAIQNPKGANGYKVAADILRMQVLFGNPKKYSDRLIQENQNITPADPEKVRQEIKRLSKELGLKAVGE